MFTAISVNKDVIVISDFSPPNVKFSVLWMTRKEKNMCYPAAIRLQPLPTVNSEKLKM